MDEQIDKRTMLCEKYLTAYHTLKFHSSTSDCENPDPSSERIDSIFKYLSSSGTMNKSGCEIGTILFEKNFTSYKRQLHAARVTGESSEPKVQFKSGLKKDVLLNFVRPLSCRKKSVEMCQNAFSSRLSQSNLRILVNTHWKKKEVVSFGEKLKLSNGQQLRCETRGKLFRSSLNTSPNAGAQCTAPKERRENVNPETFVTAKNKLQADSKNSNLKKKSSVNNQFICPVKREGSSHGTENEATSQDTSSTSTSNDERLKNIDEKMIELIKNEIMYGGALIDWNDIAGLSQVKRVIQEIVVFPMLRPDMFTGLRNPPKGILLFGPPGTGKTLIGKCIASQSKSTFFSISASSLTSKWIGEGEKMVRALFAVARVYQPSVVFIDEIDSLLTQRSETEHESSRRIKTEFLVQLDGATTDKNDRILIVGATNRPHELDEAARRRFVKRLYIPLPECDARKQIIENLLKTEQHDLTPQDIDEIAKSTHNYSGADVTNLCKEASMEPIRSIPFDQLEKIDKKDIRSLTSQDFQQALAVVRPSVSQSDLGIYVKWNQTYGSGTSGNP